MYYPTNSKDPPTFALSLYYYNTRFPDSNPLHLTTLEWGQLVINPCLLTKVFVENSQRARSRNQLLLPATTLALAHPWWRQTVIIIILIYYYF